MRENAGTINAIVTTAEMYTLLGISRSHFERIAATGVAKPRSPNCWPIVETFQGFWTWARAENRNGSKTAVQSRVQAARVKEIELRIAERAHIVVDIEESYALVDDVFGNLRAELSGLPAMISRDLKLRDEIEHRLDDILNRAANRLELRAAALRETGETPTRPITVPS